MSYFSGIIAVVAAVVLAGGVNAVHAEATSQSSVLQVEARFAVKEADCFVELSFGQVNDLQWHTLKGEGCSTRDGGSFGKAVAENSVSFPVTAGLTAKQISEQAASIRVEGCWLALLNDKGNALINVQLTRSTKPGNRITCNYDGKGLGTFHNLVKS